MSKLITSKDIAQTGACSFGQEQFKRLFPRGTRGSEKDLLKLASAHSFVVDALDYTGQEIPYINALETTIEYLSDHLSPKEVRVIEKQLEKALFLQPLKDAYKEACRLVDEADEEVD